MSHRIDVTLSVNDGPIEPLHVGETDDVFKAQQHFVKAVSHFEDARKAHKAQSPVVTEFDKVEIYFMVDLGQHSEVILRFSCPKDVGPAAIRDIVSKLKAAK